MEYSLEDLKKKTVISVEDGKKLGKISDITLSFPQCCFVNFTVSPSICMFMADKIVLSPCNIEKIGEDAILVKLKHKPCNCKKNEEDAEE